jgi:ribonuclease P/MRP protein subunit RPP1
MVYDLNIPWSSNQNPLELQRTISFLSELGYSTLALNHIVTGSLPSTITNPIPEPLPFTTTSKVSILRRCTLQISDPTQNHRLPALSAAYDILAVRPTTEKAFLAACISISEHSLISLDLSTRFPFHFKPKPFMTAINRGVMIEICYAQAMVEDSAARRNFISNCLAILRVTKGRGLVLSSEAKGVLGVRAPADVVNLMAVWGLARNRAEESLSVVPRGVVVNERLKRTSFRGIVDVIDGGERPATEKKEKENTTKGAGIGKKGKRKIDSKETSGDGTPTMSKRQEKKMRLAAKAPITAETKITQSEESGISKDEAVHIAGTTTSIDSRVSKPPDTPGTIKGTNG